MMRCVFGNVDVEAMESQMCLPMYLCAEKRQPRRIESE